MLKCGLRLHSTRGTKPMLKIYSQQNVRWITAVSSNLDDATTLAAAKPFQDIPHFRIVPLLGTGWVYLPIIGDGYDRKNFSKAFEAKRKVLGDIFREKFGKISMVVSFNADDLQAMYKNEGVYPERNELQSVKAYRLSRKEWYTTLGLVFLNGKEWHDIRTKTQKHLMKSKAVQAFLDPMQDVASDLVKKILLIRDSKNEVPNFLEELYKWGLESITLVGLDTRLGCLDMNLPPDSDGMKMIDATHASSEVILELESFPRLIPLWQKFSFKKWKKFEEANDTFTRLAFKHVNRSLERLKNSSEKDQELTILQSLLLREGMDASTAMVTVMDMLGAGIDSTSNTIGIFLYHLARNPDKQELLYQDLKRILPGKEDRITPSIYNELKYLKACIKESMRLNPVVAAHVRTLGQDGVFSGYRVPAGTLLLVIAQSIYKDERYFSNPNQFLPERWLQKDDKFHPYSFLPFGFGVRSCVGRRLAELEMVCLAAELVRKFKTEYHYEDIEMTTKLINVPDKPLRFTFTER